MSKVVVRLVGGLGNQMFQYAAARAVALSNQVPLSLDTSWFINADDRRYALAPFHIDAVLVPSTLHSKPSGRWVKLLSRLGVRLGMGNSGLPRYVEKRFTFDPAVAALQAPIYLDGYFQSEKYFERVRRQIASEFTLRSEPSPQTRDMLLWINEVDSICVHIRRGDYVSNSATHAYHGICSLDYYRAGLEIVCQGLDRPHCFVFSDDPEWVRENFQANLPFTSVDIHGAQEAHEDLRLMAACRRFVIANSSLSWWGAWLGSRNGKIVVAPKRWFQSGNNDTRDLIPAGWLRV